MPQPIADKLSPFQQTQVGFFQSFAAKIDSVIENSVKARLLIQSQER